MPGIHVERNSTIPIPASPQGSQSHVPLYHEAGCHPKPSIPRKIKRNDAGSSRLHTVAHRGVDAALVLPELPHSSPMKNKD